MRLMLWTPCEYAIGRFIVDVAQEGHRGLKRNAAKIVPQIGEMYGVHKHTQKHTCTHTIL